MSKEKEKTLVSITSSAVEQLLRIRTEQSIPEDQALRIGVKGGGCSGFEYILDFEETKEGDQSFVIEGKLKAIINKSHSLYLMGMEIDWSDGLDNRGFIFNNPNAKDTCGCGTSFSA